MTEKKIIVLFPLFILAILVVLLPAPVLADGDDFRFVHLTDTHIGYVKGNQYTAEIIDDIAENFNDIKLVVHGGDVTELGLPSEYETYQEIISKIDKPFYHTPGNHESRWTDAGKGIFQSNLGQTYRSWDYQGIHFVTLDTSIALSQNGHLEKKMLNWLESDLKEVDKSTPIIFFSHHPLFFDEAINGSKFMDNDYDLWPIIKDYNVAAIFTGHGHKDMIWKVNGITCIMTEAAMDGGYSIIQVNQGDKELVVYNRLVQGDTLKEFARIPLIKPELKKEIKISKPTSQVITDDKISLKAVLTNWSEKPLNVQYKLEDYPWKPLENSANSYGTEIDLTEVDDGIRSIWVRAIDGDGEIYLDRISFFLTKTGKVQILWQVDTEGGIQHSPALSEKGLYIGDNSGKVYNFEQNSGKKLWEFQAEGAVVGSPVYRDGIIYVGSTGGNIYALEGATGKKIWEYNTGGAVVAAPVVADNKLFVGSSDFNMYALDAESGKVIWKFPVGNSITSAAAYGDGTVFFGSWDRRFYALDAETGEEKWRREIGGSAYYAPAASTPFYWQGKVFVSTPAGLVFAFKGETGEQLWDITASSGLSTPVIYQGALVYNTISGGVYALDPATGENVWQNDTGVSSYIASPLVQGGNIIYQGFKGRVVSLNAYENSQQWSFNLGETYLFNKGVSQGDLLFIGTLKGQLFALKSEISLDNKPFPKFAAFNDIVNHWARKDLNKVAEKGWIKGYSDGTFRPEDSVTRAQMATILSRFLNYQEPLEVTVNFADLNGHWAQKPVLAMAEKGIALGYQKNGESYFFPDKMITRAEAAVMVARALNLSAPSEGFVSKFADLNEHWAQDAILALEEKGIIGGFAEDEESNPLFRPEDNLTRAEIGVILVRAQ